jgi:hypothetical protein
MTEIVCKQCQADVDVVMSLRGKVIVDKNPNSLGGYALLGRLALIVVPDGEPLVQGDGRVHVSSARRDMLIRFMAHEASCERSYKPKPVELTDTREVLPRQRRKRPNV